MHIITNRMFPAFSSDIQNYRNWSIDYQIEAEAMQGLQPRVNLIIEEVADVIQDTRPLVVPMIWSMYGERLWDPQYGSVKPAVTISQSSIVYTRLDYNCTSSSRMGQIFEDSVTIPVRCAPCWEAYKRWGWELIESFYRALRALREAYDIHWQDKSDVLVRDWQEPCYRYVSKEQIRELVTYIEPYERYGEMVSQRKTKVNIQAEFVLPRTPEDEKNSGNCHVIEEEVIETVKKKIKRIRCV